MTTVSPTLVAGIVVELGTTPDAVVAPDALDRRSLAMLRAVFAGRGELVWSVEPDLIIDGLCCCDQFTAHQLAHAGLIRPVTPGAVGQRVRAELTRSGRTALTQGSGATS